MQLAYANTQVKNPAITELAPLCLQNPLLARGTEEQRENLFRKIIDAHTAPDRYYHNVQHLAEMVQFIAPHIKLLERPSEVHLAILFHDIVYDARNYGKQPTNERQSAGRMRTLLREFQIDESAIARIESLIIATERHLPVEGLPDSRLFLDADLAIFSKSHARYKEYARAIRAEFGHVEHCKYCTERGDFVVQFRNRDKIYLCTELYPERDQLAKGNLMREELILGHSRSTDYIDWDIIPS